MIKMVKIVAVAVTVFHKNHLVAGLLWCQASNFFVL